MKIEDVRILHQPLGDEIHVAVIDKRIKGRTVAVQRVDRTSDFLHAFMDWCGPGESRQVTRGDETFTVTVVEDEPGTEHVSRENHGDT